MANKKTPSTISFTGVAAWTLPLILLLAALFTGYSKNTRQQVLKLFYDKDQRELLATVSGQLGRGQDLFTIAKYSTSSGILIEVYQTTQQGGVETLIDRVYLGDRRNAFFKSNGEAIQLALIDLNRDGDLKVIAPTFDDQLQAHLNAFKLDPELKRLVPFSSKQ